MFKTFKKISFSLKRKKEIFLIDDDEDKNFVIDSLNSEKIIGLDTEFSWRRTYFPELSLLQISTKTKIFLIDFLKIKSGNFLKEILEDRGKKFILHSSRSDSTVLSNSLNIKLKNTFDIQIAEKYINGGEINNYGSIVSKYFGFELDKSETNSNWLKRPLSNDQLDYASDDVNFLIPIFEKQSKILKKIKKLNEVISSSLIETGLGNQELSFSRIKKIENASNYEKKVFMWRENLAKSENVPTSYIFKTKKLSKLCSLYKKKSSKSKMRDIFNDNYYFEKFLEDFKS